MNYKTFTNIGKAYGGVFVVARETMELENLIEAKAVKVHYNFTGFVPASILISDNEGKHSSLSQFPHQTVDG